VTGEPAGGEERERKRERERGMVAILPRSSVVFVLSVEAARWSHACAHTYESRPYVSRQASWQIVANLKQSRGPSPHPFKFADGTVGVLSYSRHSAFPASLPLPSPS